MSSTPPLPLDVAMAGLDLLAQTRLKVACSLMAAERLALRLVPWGDGPCALLVADQTSPPGREAIASAAVARMPVIRLADAADDATPGRVLGRQATVREYVDALRAGLAEKSGSEPADGTGEALPPLLEQLRRDRPGRARVLMVNGLVRLVVDGPAGEVHLLRRMPLDEVLSRALRQDWSVTELDEATWRSRHAGDVTSTHSIESLWWRIAPILPAERLGVEFQGLQMLAWPDLDPGTVDAAWILPMACLQVGEWRPMQLASATQLPLKEVRRIMAAARYAGLAGRPVQDGEAARPRRSTASQALSVFKIARRFGLKWLGVANG